jgi:hypothetical protein
MSLLPSNFDLLPPLEKRAAVEQATGMTWDQYSLLPGEQKTALLLSLKGVSVQGTASDMLGAAKMDATLNRLAGYWGGFTGATKLVLLATGIGIVWLALPTLGKTVSSVRKAVEA